MAELKNTFSWSYSASEDFDTCRRKRYWSKYGMWGGWNRDASDEQKAAYRLNKMSNRFSIQGEAVEQAAMWMLREHQAGRLGDPEAAYEQIAKPLLNQAWKESLSKRWQHDPKRVTCLHEHYYAEDGTDPDKSRAWTEGVIATVKLCLTNFKDHTMARYAEVKPSQEIEVATITRTRGGDPESFIYEGVKIYAIPDYVYVDTDGRWIIVDWKSGRQKEGHRDQIGVYGLWAVEKHGVSPDNITVRLEYLQDNAVLEEPFSAERLQAVLERISESVGEMAEHLVDFDLQANQALPKTEWELTPHEKMCHWCSFFELCQPERSEP